MATNKPAVKVVRVQRKPAKPKPMSEQAQRSLAKERLMKDETFPFPVLPVSEKASLADDDLRNHLPSAELNKLYFNAAKQFAGGKGRVQYKMGASLTEGTATFTVKVRLSADNSTKMGVALATKAMRAEHGRGLSDHLAKMASAKPDTSTDYS